MVDQIQPASFGSQVFMMSMPINVATRSKYYQTVSLIVGKEKEAAPSSSTLISGSLHIERHNPNSAIQPPSRGVLWEYLFNPNA